MKKIYLLIMLSLLSCVSSCSTQSEYEKTILDYLENRNSIHTDLKIKILSFEYSNITVQDSIEIIKTNFEKEKTKRIVDLKATIKRYEERIAEHRSRNDIVGQAAAKDQERLLEMEKASLYKAEKWNPDILYRYDNTAVDEILAKKILCSFSFYNPKIQIRQTYKNAIFILSPDGNKVLDATLNNK